MSDEAADLQAQILALQAQKLAIEEEIAAIRKENPPFPELRSLNLEEYLRCFHEVHSLIKPVEDIRSAARFAVANPEGRWRPRRISPWQGFSEEQTEIWKYLRTCEDLCSQQVYPCRHIVDCDKRKMAPIGSYQQLCTILHFTLEPEVKRVFETLSKHETFAQRWSLHDYEVTYETTRTNRYCTLRENGASETLCAVEYKPPYKVTLDLINKGLGSEMTMADILGTKPVDTPDYKSKRIMALIINQLFSYMIDRPVKYGYICTGEALIFLCLGDDPAEVHYSISTPKQEVGSDPYSYEKTAIAQILAFIMQAIADRKSSQEWLDLIRDRHNF